MKNFKNLLALSILMLALGSCRIYKEIPPNLEGNIPTIEDLQNFYDDLDLGFTEPYESKRWISIVGGLGMLDYGFDNENDPLRERIIYQYMMEIEANEEDARDVLADNVDLFGKEFQQEGFSERELLRLDLPGDLYYASEFYYEGDPLATLVVVKIRNKVVTFFINGTENRFPGLISRFLLPYLEYTEHQTMQGYDRIAPLQTI